MVSTGATRPGARLILMTPLVFLTGISFYPGLTELIKALMEGKVKFGAV